MTVSPTARRTPNSTCSHRCLKDCWTRPWSPGRRRDCRSAAPAPLSPSAGVSIDMERECQQNDSSPTARSPCLWDCTLCDADSRMTMAVLLPFVGRAILGWLAGKLKLFVKKRCSYCKPAGRAATSHGDKSWPMISGQSRLQPVGAAVGETVLLLHHLSPPTCARLLKRQGGCSRKASLADG